MVSIKCDVHSWMQAWAGVTTHPYFAVTDGKGAFNIDTKGLADGDYERSEEHTSELQSLVKLVCRLLLEKHKTIWKVERTNHSDTT